MKKIIIIISILFIISNANSQIAKTYWMYGGSGEYYHKTTGLTPYNSDFFTFDVQR